MGHTQNEKQFVLAETTKSDHQLSKMFCQKSVITSLTAATWDLIVGAETH